MNQTQLVPARNLATQFGVKGIFYGAPGSGKTPIVGTAPRPVMLVSEPGMLTMRNSNVPCWQGDTPARIDEFFQWVFSSAEMQNFDTIAIDSGSEVAEIVLREEIARQKDGRKAYGNMSERCCRWFDGLYALRNKHVYIICKQSSIELITTTMQGLMPVISTLTKFQPYFPGKDLPMKVSHKYDLICQVGKFEIPGAGKHQAFRCHESDTVTARDRSGKLAEFEPPNLTQLFAKAMS